VRGLRIHPPRGGKQYLPEGIVDIFQPIDVCYDNADRVLSAIFGITIRHSFEHFTRAVLEGVAFGLRDSFELMKNLGLKKFTQVRVTGGGVKSSIWRQIIADILKVEIVTVTFPQYSF